MAWTGLLLNAVLLSSLTLASELEGPPEFWRKMPVLDVVPVNKDFRFNCSARNAVNYTFSKDGMENFSRYFGKTVSCHFLIIYRINCVLLLNIFELS